MKIPLYLARSASEMGANGENVAWLSCHFSPWSAGLTNLPTALPAGSLLILDDSTHIAGHDGQLIFKALTEAVERLECGGVLLDFERPPGEEGLAMAQRLLALPCPVCVAAEYGKRLDCPVFLPPVPLLEPLEDYLKPWAGRELWLDLCPAAARVTVTENGYQTAPLPCNALTECPHEDKELHCHYGVSPEADRAVFTLRRSAGDCRQLLQAAGEIGVTKGVALWQEFEEKP